jgi:large subunit ribosomal protein L10
VSKNTLFRIAAKDTGYDDMLGYLEGQTAIAFAKDDPAVAAKILYNSYKDMEKPVIKAFFLDKETFPGTEIVRLAELPSKEILLSRIVSAVESPITSVISSVDAVFQELVATVEALAKSKGA